jgi:hypothetical protein
MEVLIEQAYLFNDALVEFTPLSIRQLADVPALELRNVPGVELDRASLLLNPDGILRQCIQDSAHAGGSVGVMKLASDHGPFLIGAWEELAGQPHGRATAEVFNGRELVVIRLSFRPMAAINST